MQNKETGEMREVEEGTKPDVVKGEIMWRLNELVDLRVGKIRTSAVIKKIHADKKEIVVEPVLPGAGETYFCKGMKWDVVMVEGSRYTLAWRGKAPGIEGLIDRSQSARRV